MSKRFGLTILILATAVSLPAAPASEKSFEISLFGGFGLARSDGKAVHEDTWSFYQLTRVWERTDIRVEGKKPFFLSAQELGYVLEHQTLTPLKFHAPRLQVRAGLKLRVG